MQKAIHPLPNLKRNLKLLLGLENSHLMILRWQHGILDPSLFLVKVVLAVYLRGGLKRMELLQWSLAQGLLLLLKRSIMMGFRVIKNGWFETFLIYFISHMELNSFICSSPTLCFSSFVFCFLFLIFDLSFFRNPFYVLALLKFNLILQAEVNFLGDLIHPNLVKLIGYCIEDDQRLLVYEFMPRGSLENHLFRSMYLSFC